MTVLTWEHVFATNEMSSLPLHRHLERFYDSFFRSQALSLSINLAMEPKIQEKKNKINKNMVKMG